MHNQKVRGKMKGVATKVFVTLIFLALVEIGNSAPLQEQYTWIPECSHLQTDETQLNAKLFPSGKKCCFCPMGTFYSKDCNDTNPQSTECTSCTYTEDYKSYVDYEPHIRNKCFMQKDCMPGKISVGGSRTQEAKCVCPNGTVEVEKHCEVLVDVLNEKKSTSVSSVTTLTEGEGAKLPTTEHVIPTELRTSSTKEQIKTMISPESSQVEMFTSSTMKMDIKSPTLGKITDDSRFSTGSIVLSSSTRSPKVSDFLISVTIICTSLIAVLLAVLIYFILRIRRTRLTNMMKSLAASSSSSHGAHDNQPIVRYHPPSDTNNIPSGITDSPPEDQNSGEEAEPLLPEQEKTSNNIGSTSEVDNDTLPFAETDDKPGIEICETTSLDEEPSEQQEKIFELTEKSQALNKAGPIEERSGPQVERNEPPFSQQLQSDLPDPVSHSQSDPVDDVVVAETRTENCENTSSDEQPSDQPEESFELTEKSQALNKAGPIEERIGPQVEIREEAPNTNGMPRLLSREEKKKRNKVLEKMSEKIVMRDLPKISRSMLPLEEYNFIDEMLEKYPHHTAQAAYAIFKRVREVNSNITLQEIMTKVEGLGYLKDIVREEMQ